MNKRLLLIFLLPLLSFGQVTIEMEKQQGVYMVPCKINGVPLAMVLDTGASDVIISSTEAAFLLKQGLILKEDFLGDGKYQTADGGIIEGTYINIRELHIGDVLLRDVKAAVIKESNAPILLGQSALSRLGAYRILENKLIIEDYFSISSDQASILCEKNGYKSLNFDMKAADLPPEFTTGNCNVGKEKIVCIIEDVTKEFITTFGVEMQGLVVYFSKEEKDLERIQLIKGYLVKLDPSAGDAIPKPPTQEFDHLYNNFSSVLGKPELMDSENTAGTTIYWNCKDVSLVISFRLKDIDFDKDINMLVTYTMEINFVKSNFNSIENLINQF